MHGSVGYRKLCFSPGIEAACAPPICHSLGPGLQLVCTPRGACLSRNETCMPSLRVMSSLCVLTRLLPILQMAPSEGTVTQIGLLSQDIHRLTVGP